MSRINLAMSLLLMSGVSVFLLPQAVQAQDVDLSIVAKNTLKSVVLIVAADKNDNPIGLGSGFFIRNGWIATNYHVIEGADNGFVRLVGKEDLFPVLGTIALSEENDLAILAVEAPGMPYLELDTDNEVAIGNAVYAAGNPRGVEGTFSDGIVSAFQTLSSRQRIQFTAPISSGSSGGPLVNQNGGVIGIVVSTIDDAQNLNFAIPAQSLKQLMESVPGGTSPQQFNWSRKQKTKPKIDSPDANLFFGFAHFYGYGEYRQDQRKGVRYITDAAESGNRMAQHHLGGIYYHGEGVKQSYKKAFKWYLAAAEQDDVDSQVMVGIMYRNGQGVPESERKAFEWVHRAAELGDPGSQYVLALNYHHGVGVAVDRAQALKWYQEAAENGNVEAQIIISDLYLKQGNKKEAFNWKLRAAQQGDTSAQGYVAGSYYLGNGVAKDTVLAYAWANVASVSGEPNIIEAKRLMAEGLTDEEIARGQEISIQLDEEIQARIAENK